MMKWIYAPLIAGVVGWAMLFQSSTAQAAQTKEKVLHSFGSYRGGTGPKGGLIDVNGVLYGTTAVGGKGSGGIVFAYDPTTGAEKALYNFCLKPYCADGKDPTASLIYIRGKLYGTTQAGGAHNMNGTVFALDIKNGTERVLYSFSGNDGSQPAASLIDVNGTLYGTTSSGGANGTSCNYTGCGTVFALDRRTGAETVLYSFCSQGACTDGAQPFGNLIDVDGTLYGTTSGGGSYEGGTMFALNPSTGTETVLYSFCSEQNCADGWAPYAGVIDVNGTLYGTTGAGGTHANGTVFALNPNTGSETVLYSFCALENCTDGANPTAGLTYAMAKAKLYGTTFGGGFPGSAFAIDLQTGAETLLHAFCNRLNCVDGKWPGAGLIDVKGTLYGTTWDGGTINSGGTLFSLAKH